MTQYITHWMPIPDFALSLNLPIREVTDEEIRKVFYNLCTDQAYTGYAVIREDIFIKVVRDLLTKPKEEQK